MKHIEMYKMLRWRLWFNCFDSITRNQRNKVIHHTIPIKTQKEKAKTQIVMELYIPASHNCYAMVGFEYSPSEVEETEIIVCIDSDSEPVKYENSLIQLGDKVYWGISEEYCQCILDSVVLTLQEMGTGYPGKFNFNVGAYAEVSSSIFMFRKVTKLAVQLMQMDFLNLSDKAIRDIINTMVLLSDSEQSTINIIKSLI